jgi:hypothetical protein
MLLSEARHVLGLRKPAAIEIVAPAERHGSPLALEALKLEFLKRQSFEILKKEGFFLSAQEIRLIAETIEQPVASEEMKRRLPLRTRLLSGAGRRPLCLPKRCDLPRDRPHLPHRILQIEQKTKGKTERNDRRLPCRRT